MLTRCLQVDFSRVGLATNLNAPAARMRYCRLKKNIEDKLSEGSNKAPVFSNGSTAAAKVKSTVGSKKRKVSLRLRMNRLTSPSTIRLAILQSVSGFRRMRLNRGPVGKRPISQRPLRVIVITQAGLN
jgi:hypothetical protein